MTQDEHHEELVKGIAGQLKQIMNKSVHFVSKI
jgi:hypothetical protein